MIYGYGLNQVNEFGLFEMKEITFAASSTVLRQVAQFLEDMAQKMDDGYFETCSHIHIGSMFQDWDKSFPNKDIIVMPPNFDSKVKLENVPKAL